MKVSIITAVYNRESTIADCLASVHLQTHPQLEHVIVDGSSKDSTMQIISQSPHREGSVVSEPDKGIYNAINKGIQRATGDIVGLLHADDLFDNERVIADVVALFEKTGADALYGDLEYVSASNTQQVVRYWKSGEFTKGIMTRGWMPPHPTVFVRRSLFETLGFYREDMRIAADYEWLLRWIHFGGVKPVYLPKVITRMRVGGASNKSIKNVMKKTSEDLKAWNLNGNIFQGVAAVGLKNVSKIGQFWRRRG